jgi:hypothetical protein
MIINVLLATFTDIIKAQQDHATGNADVNDVLEAKKRFSQALNEYIDYRIDLAFEERRRKMSSDRIATADSINVGVKSMATAVKSISALNSAPPPPTDPKDIHGMEKWKEAYADWYENKRKSGMIIG